MNKNNLNIIISKQINSINKLLRLKKKENPLTKNKPINNPKLLIISLYNLTKNIDFVNQIYLKKVINFKKIIKL